MLQITNSTLSVTCNKTGHGLMLTDLTRGMGWMLDEKTVVYSQDAAMANFKPLLPVSARSEGTYPPTLILTYRAGELPLEMRFTLLEDCLEIVLPPAAVETPQYFDGQPDFTVSLPGSFTPLEGAPKWLLPIMQGMLWDGRGQPFSMVRGEGAHTGFSMSFTGCLGGRGGLLVTAETRDDCRWWFGKDDHQRTWAANLQMTSLGSMGYPRAVRVYPTDADIVAVAKTYRRRVIQRGRFKSWADKIAERPQLERLFGSLMCFIGYCQDELDYHSECQKLKTYGFDRALVYPARFNMYYPDIRMGGAPAINLDAGVVEAIKNLGYDVAPWSWLNEALDTGSEEIQRIYRRDRQGKTIPGWGIDTQQWYEVCHSTIPDYQRRALTGDTAGYGSAAEMTWDHFDVLSCLPPMECYSLDHAAHTGRPLSRTEDRAGICKTFLVDQAAGRMVSSESFNDAYSLEYDFGSVKAWSLYGPYPFWPIPLTMLVYHDSLIHSWWEPHNYNNPWHGRTAWLGGLFEYGGGRPRLMAAADALMGCPPDVFPFGAMYGYTGNAKKTFLYKIRFEDPEVQIALREALPVARLHRRIGKQEMVHFKILSEDGYLQETAFADGTRVVANFSQDMCGHASDNPNRTTPHGVESLKGESWQVID